MTDALQEYALAMRETKMSPDHVFFIFEWNEDLTKTIKMDGVSVGQLVKDLRSVIRTITIMGMTGQAYIKSHLGQDYLILKGRPGERPKQLQGTRYLAENPKVNFMSVGVRGILKGATDTVIVGIFAYVALDTMRALTGDLNTLGKFTGTLGMDIAKCVAASAVGFAAAAGTVSAALFWAVTLGVAGPMIVAVAVGAGAGIALELLDEKFRITDRVCGTIDVAIASARNKLSSAAEAANFATHLIQRGLASLENYQELRGIIQKLSPGHYLPGYELHL